MAKKRGKKAVSRRKVSKKSSKNVFETITGDGKRRKVSEQNVLESIGSRKMSWIPLFWVILIILIVIFIVLLLKG